MCFNLLVVDREDTISTVGSSSAIFCQDSSERKAQGSALFIAVWARCGRILFISDFNVVCGARLVITNTFLRLETFLVSFCFWALQFYVGKSNPRPLRFVSCWSGLVCNRTLLFYFQRIMCLHVHQPS